MKLTISDNVIDIAYTGLPYGSVIYCNKGSYTHTILVDRNYDNYVLLNGTQEDNTVSGTLDPNFAWVLNKVSGELTISCESGTGELSNSIRYDIQDLPCFGLVNSINIGDGITSIGESAFEECTSLTTVNFGDSVTSIGDRAFSRCTSLTTVNFGDSVTSIGDRAFSHCFSLASVNLGNSLLSIGSEAFIACYALKNMTIPACVSEIGSYAVGCTDMRLIGSVDEIREYYSMYLPIEPYLLAGLMFIEEAKQKMSEAEALSEELVEPLETPVAIDGFAVIGYANTAAQTYAAENNIPFINVGECPHKTYISKEAKAVTCTENGCTAEIKCSVCGVVVTASEVIAAPGHSYSEWKVTREANVACVGEKQRTCSTCKNVESEAIAQLDGVTVTDKVSGVTASYSEGTFTGKVELAVKQVFDGTTYQALDRKYAKCSLFDIILTQDGKNVQPNGTVWVKLPLPEGYDSAKTAVYYIDEAGESVKMNSFYYEGCIYFETTHFSSYSLIDEGSFITEQHKTVNKFTNILNMLFHFFEILFSFITTAMG